MWTHFLFCWLSRFKTGNLVVHTGKIVSRLGKSKRPINIAGLRFSVDSFIVQRANYSAPPENGATASKVFILRRWTKMRMCGLEGKNLFLCFLCNNSNLRKWAFFLETCNYPSCFDRNLVSLLESCGPTIQQIRWKVSLLTLNCSLHMSSGRLSPARSSSKNRCGRGHTQALLIARRRPAIRTANIRRRRRLLHRTLYSCIRLTRLTLPPASATTIAERTTNSSISSMLEARAANPLETFKVWTLFIC